MRTMPKEMVNELTEELTKVNKKIMYINNGGCGFFAIALCNELKRIGFRAKILVVYKSPHDQKKFKEFLTNNRRVNENTNVALSSMVYSSWTHFMVKCKGKIIDSTGVYNKLTDTQYFDYRLTKHSLSPDILSVFCGDEFRDNWNRVYNRDDNSLLNNEVKEIANKMQKYIK